MKNFFLFLIALLICEACTKPNSKDFNIDKNGTLISYTGTGGTIKIPNTVKNIGYAVFFNNNKVSSVTIPSSVENISEYAFHGCETLQTLIFEPNSSLRSIKNGAFYNTGITSVIIPASTITIGDGAFHDCNELETLTFESNSSLQDIGNGAFYGTSICKISIPASTKNIAHDAFYLSSKLNYISVEPDNQYFCGINGVLYNKEQSCIILYPQAKNERNYLFPESVTSIEYGAFQENIHLTSIDIPEKITKIDDYAFYNCKGITDITVHWKNPSTVNYGQNIFSGIKKKSVRLHVPVGTKKLYNDYPWHGFHIIEDSKSRAETTKEKVAVVYASGKNIIVENTKIGSNLLITDIEGKIINKTITTSNQTTIPIAEKNIYIVYIEDQKIKVVCD
jgi:hypothetical protein